MTFKCSLAQFLLLFLFFSFVPLSNAFSEEVETKKWNVRCDESNGKCEVFQRYIIKETGQRIIEFAIGYPEKDKGAVGVIILPLGIKVNQPIQIKMDEKEYQVFEVESCSQDGCFSTIKVDSSFINALQGSAVVSFAFYNLANQTINVEMSTKGFTEAFLTAIQSAKAK